MLEPDIIQTPTPEQDGYAIGYCNFSATVSPTSSDDSTLGYSRNSVWYRTDNDRIWKCVDNTESAAEWIELTTYSTPISYTVLTGLSQNTLLGRTTSGVGAVEAISLSANQFVARSSSGAMALKTITDFGLSLIDDADASAARSTLGLGTMATQNGLTVGSTSISSGGNGRILVQAAGALQEYSTFVFDGTNLGIGTNSPTAPLHLRKAADNHLLIDQAAVAGLDLWHEYSTGDNYIDSLYTHASNGNLRFRTQTYTTPINAMFIKGSNGYVGIGTTSPAALLHVSGSTEQMRVAYNTTNYFKTTVSSAGAVVFDAVGASAGFSFNDPVTVPNFTSTQITDNGTDIALNAAGVLNLLGAAVHVGDTGSADVYIAQNTGNISFFSGSAMPQSTGWAVTGYSDRRTFDPTTDSLGDFMDFVCTLVNVHLANGYLGA